MSNITAQQLILSIALPLPPSVNSRLDSNKRLTPEARRFIRESQAILQQRKVDQVIDETIGRSSPIYLKIIYNWILESKRQLNQRDADNMIKAAQDVLCEALKVNDACVYLPIAVKAGIDDFRPRAEIRVWALFGNNLDEGLGIIEA